MARVLFPLPDKDFDVTEVSVPWKLLTRAGHQVVFASEAGARPEADPLLIRGVLFGKLGAAPEPLAWYREMQSSPEIAAPLTWDSLAPADFDALYLAGGHAPGMRQYLGSALLQKKVGEFFALDRPVAAICHGVLLAARSPLLGRSVLHERRTTCLPRYMERNAFLLTFWRHGRYYRTYPEYVEDEVKAVLKKPQSQFILGPRVLTKRGSDDDDTHAFVVEDKNYVSARWPGDAYLLAKTLLARL
jgi:putative intracellular protease/amidase